MRVAIISDIHDNLANLKKCLDWCAANAIDALFCCGDITNGETLKYLAKNFNHDIYLIRGNMEIYEANEVKLYSNIIYFGRYGIFNLAGKTIGLCHEPSFINKVKEMAKGDLIFYGHTHKPWLEETKDIKIINPGTLGGVFQRASFAVWDIDRDFAELKILDVLF